MAVIESVAMRQKGGLDFEMHYDNVCALNNLWPLPAVKSHLRQNKLDLNGDRIKANDWIPILNAIRINKTLEHIAIRSFYQQEIEEKDLVRVSARRPKVPVIRCKELTNRVCRALRECLAVNPVLQIIELEGLPLRPKDMEALAKGISKTKCLRHISLENTCIGDDQLTVLCRVIKNTMSITSVNFSGCSLTWRSAETIADVIKHQGTMRHTEAWQDSLRYRRPDLDRMAGLRRITANYNSLIGDKGAAALADVLRDDLWVKAVDLHQCGIGDVGGKALIEILKINTTLVIMDVRLNPLISQETMACLNDQVFLNSASCDSEYQYKWLKINQEQKTPAKCKQYRSKKRAKVLQGYGRKSTVVRASSSYLQRRLRSTPSSACRSFEPVCTDYMKPGTPWRTALRAAQHRGEIPDPSAAKVNLYESLSEMSNPMVTVDQSDFVDAGNYSQIREIKVELEMLQRSAADESVAKRSLERRVQELTSENTQLRQELKELQAKRSILDNDQILDSIEQSFHQFHSFLDLLRDVGLGQLIAMAGLDQASMPFQKDSAGPLERDGSRLDTTRQMKSFLEQSRLDASELSFVSDAQLLDKDSSYCRSSLFRNRSSDSFHGVVPYSKSSLNFSSHNKPMFEDGKQPRSTTSKFDELYQKALRNTETILQRKEFLPPNNDATTEIGQNGVQKPRINGQATEFPAVGGREIEGASSEITAGILRDGIKAGTSDNQLSERSDSVSLSAGKRRDASNKSEPRSSQDSAAKLSAVNFQQSGQATVSDAVPGQKVLSDRSEKSALSDGGSRQQLAATMSELQDDRQTGDIVNFNKSGANESIDTVDEQSISEDSEIEELLELNDSDVRGGADGAL